jgi:hypothetical protein
MRLPEEASTPPDLEVTFSTPFRVWKPCTLRTGIRDRGGDASQSATNIVGQEKTAAFTAAVERGKGGKEIREGDSRCRSAKQNAQIGYVENLGRVF